MLIFFQLTFFYLYSYSAVQNLLQAMENFKGKKKKKTT